MKALNSAEMIDYFKQVCFQRQDRLIRVLKTYSFHPYKSKNFANNFLMTSVDITDLLWIYVTYAAAVWAHPMQSRKVKHLYTIQRPFALGITRAYRTTSSDAINVLAGLLPLHIRVKEEAARQFVLQLKRPVSFDEVNYHPEDYETNSCQFSVHPAVKGTGVNITINPTTTHHPAQHTIYTDGSKIDEKVGSAFVVMQQGNPDHPSGIIQGIQEDLWKNSSLRTKLEWIKAHAGYHGNELADHLAKEAATGQTDLQIDIPWPVSFLKRTMRLKAIGLWQQTWDNSETGRRAHYHISYVDTTRNIANTQLVRYITGHGPFPEYFNRFGISHTSQCTCGQTGSPEHYITSCPLTEELHVNFPSTNRQAF
ncbi:uncharacterized protein LOC118190839, partial [Stegodyphus dumicola]|uniref:uncharacterized protein LOC118190839 n=1 Tax=Stegodyphus dumicola TaxID=202533 RepID=UPI0015A92AAF